MDVTSKLFLKAAWRRERYANRSGFEDPASPSYPKIEIENSRRVGEGDHDLTFHRDAVPVDFHVKSFTKRNGVGVSLFGIGNRVVTLREPEMKSIEEVKTGPVKQVATGRLIFGTEEYGRGKYPLEAVDYAPVVASVFRKAKEFEHLRSTMEVNGPALLPEGESCYPDGDETILAEGQAEVRVGDNV